MEIVVQWKMGPKITTLSSKIFLPLKMVKAIYTFQHCYLDYSIVEKEPQQPSRFLCALKETTKFVPQQQVAIINPHFKLKQPSNCKLNIPFFLTLKNLPKATVFPTKIVPKA